MSIVISTDKEKLDINFIHEFLTRSYWAKGRTKEQIQTTIEHSMCFGIYLDEKQIGFTRVLTDYVVYAYLMDVFIIEQQQGNGYAKQLMQAVMGHPKLQTIRRWMLLTKDAHKLYQQFGFDSIDNPSWVMGKLNI
ncbi:N-acetylglutamate synthase-like GNAT family acetyltransferase [Aquimarina sp. EL_43]|uniref:GNAT family N-acetyltransferase n=1 Tax=Aquimarina TaxID=290174 RepID=UPI0004AE4107|nr:MULTISPECIES: GNAT family N-acetyltransferase [Aquimarina]MBG6130501.1 N-acetylglutamate synthase-like GNAT family acetyltransferase [Aquimarina sp. EL_35]MBG6149281.1 N-acetylglutamate synthase-like GNAT family acetyltransferase [Aquimarina sp. EL_32]MBG6168345.1 N-acetylglutamate synthase-like GNAT family acetyltransferase [Aquimarina sp. EL_43]